MEYTLREIGQGLIDPKYCCVAVPLVNFGIYSIIGEQFVVSLAAGLLSFTTPKSVGGYFPSFASYIFAICCLAVAILQPIGFIGVLREKTKTFRIYTWLNMLAIACAFITAAALIVVSGTSHNQAVDACITRFFSPSTEDTASATQMLNQQGPLICAPFAWADVGAMAGLWAVLFVVQAYFIYISKTYGRSQVSDHKLYHSVYSENPEAFTMSILQSKRYNPNSIYSSGGMPPPRLSTHYAQRDNDAWDARASMDELKKDQEGEAGDYAYGYDQGYAPGGVGYAGGAGAGTGAGAGASQQYGQQQGYGQDAYGYGAQQSMQRGASHHEGGAGSGQYDDAQPQYQHQQGYYAHTQPQHPEQAVYGREPGPTPTMNRYEQGDGVGYLQRPEGAQSHPAEGMFGRKSPRG